MNKQEIASALTEQIDNSRIGASAVRAVASGLDVQAETLTALRAALLALPDAAPPPEPEPQPFPPGWKPGGAPGWHLPHGNVYFRSPPSGYNQITPWWQAIKDSNQSGDGSVTIRNIRCYGTTNGVRRLLDSAAYNDGVSLCGGWFSLSPWFGGGVFESIASSEWQRTGDGIVIRPHLRTNRVIHGWTCQRITAPSGVRDIEFTAEVFVEGSAAFQIGGDAWGQGVSGNPEYGYSKWVGRSSQWQTVTWPSAGAGSALIAYEPDERQIDASVMRQAARRGLLRDVTPRQASNEQAAAAEMRAAARGGRG